MRALGLIIALLTLSLSELRALDYQYHKVETGSLWGKSELRLLFFRSNEHQLKVVDNGSMTKPKFVDLGAAVNSLGGIAGCNGGFFAKEGYPLGQVVEKGKAIGGVAENSALVSGVYLLSDSGPQLMRSGLYAKHRKKLSGLSDALQTGPFLVENSKVIKGLSGENRRNRTFIMEDGKGNWAIGTCQAVSLARLGEILSQPHLISGFTTRTALNLDGGTSSALFVQGSWKVRNAKPVRNYLVLTKA